MRTPRRAASMLPMPAAETLIAEPMVLVVHANFAVAGAMAQRLMESCLVALVPASSAVAGLQRHAAFDVVVLCPYMTADERARVLQACSEQDPCPAVLELCDEPGAMNAHARAVSLPAARRRPAEHVLASLSLAPSPSPSPSP